MRDVEPSIVECMMQYFYNLDYELPTNDKKAEDQSSEQQNAGKNTASGDTTNGPGSMLIHAKVYSLGEMYCIPGLKALALSKFKNWNPTSTSADQFADVAEEVFAGTMDTDLDMRHYLLENFIAMQSTSFNIFWMNRLCQRARGHQD